MYDIIKSVISAGGYKLAEMQQKVKKLYVLGDFSDAQMDELLALAAKGVSVDAERPEVLAMVQTLSGEIKALQDRVAVLESAAGGDTGADDGEAENYPAWTTWDGISDNYQKGAIVEHNGQLWQSVFVGQNVWEPGTAGTEALWVALHE